MTEGDKARAKGQEVKGKVKEVAGRESGNPDMAREGAAERRTGALKGALEKVKDAFKR